MAVKEKITLQEIADLVGVSRNTVSKIVNGRYTGSDKVRNRVITVLRENNYKGLGQLEREEAMREAKTILLLGNGETAQSDFFLRLVNRIQQNVESRGYVLVFYGVLESEMKNRQLPQMLLEDKVDGIVCIEVFYRPYIEELLSCRIPAVFLDFCRDLWEIPGRYDVVLMNREHPFFIMTEQLLKQGFTKIGFVGDIGFSRGTYECYRGYCAAMQERGAKWDNAYCIDTEGLSGDLLEENLRRKLDTFSDFPDAFAVAGDDVAVVLMNLLKERNVPVPQRVQLVSSGNSREGSETEPALTTVGCDRDELVQMVVNCLLRRMDDPSKSRSVIYVDSRILYRESSTIGTF